MKPAHNFELQIDYDEHFTEQVANGDPNPLVDLTIRIGEYDLTGASGDTYFLDDYSYFHLRKLLDAVEDIVRGEQRSLTLYSIPDDVVLRLEGDIVRVSLLNSRGERKNAAVPEGGVPVTKTAFVAGLVHAAEEFDEKVVEANPELQDSDQLRTLRQLIRNAYKLQSELDS